MASSSSAVSSSAADEADSGSGPVQLVPVVTQPTAPVARAKGKYGAKWDNLTTIAFLEACQPHKLALRKKNVDHTVWLNVSDQLFYNYRMDYSDEQCKEKMRNMKRSFKDYNEGKQKGFLFSNQMSALFNEPISDPSQPQSDRLTLNQVIGNSDSLQCEDFPFSDLDTSSGQSDRLTLNQVIGNGDSLQCQDFPFSDVDTSSGQHDTFFETSSSVLQSFPIVGSEVGLSTTVSQSVEVGLSPPQSVAVGGPQAQAGEHVQSGMNMPTQVPKKKPAVASGGTSWDKMSTKALVDACLKRKGEVQQSEDIPQRVFKDISDELKTQGFQMTPKNCKDKFTIMSEFFTSVLPSGGMRSGFMWPYYDKFSELHDLPFDFILPDNFPTAVVTYEPPAGNKTWSKPAVQLLLSEYNSRKSLFENTKSPIRHQLLYCEIAETMNQFLIPVTAKQCSDHMSALKIEFRKEFDRLDVKSTGQPPSTWPYYYTMLEMFGPKDPSLNAPFLLSVGKGLTYSISGEQVVGSSSSGTRTRPRPTASEADSSKSNKRPLTNQMFKERTVDQREDISTTLRELKDTFERNREQRSEELSDLRKIMKAALEKIS